LTPKNKEEIFCHKFLVFSGEKNSKFLRKEKKIQEELATFLRKGKFSGKFSEGGICLPQLLFGI
jgi:hypothetical protein